MKLSSRLLLLGGLILSIASTWAVLHVKGPGSAVDLHLPSIVYVYKSTPCPRSLSHFRDLESGNLLGDFQLVVIDAATLYQLFGISCARFPSVLFIKDGKVHDRIEGATTAEAIQTRSRIIAFKA